MAKPDETGALYISKLSMNGTAYTIKDAWSRAAIDDIEKAIAGGTHFLGVTTTTLADGATTNPVSIGGEDVTAANGDIVLCTITEGGASITGEFIYDGAKWQQFGTQGVLKALAYKDSASGSVTLPLSANIAADALDRVTGIGTLSVTTTTGSVTTSATPTAANAELTLNEVTVAGPTLTVTAPTGTFTALKDVTYDPSTATLSIASVTSDAFVTSVTASAASQTITPTGSVSVTYDKVSASGTFLATAGLDGVLASTNAAPTLSITNPEITVTVS